MGKSQISVQYLQKHNKMKSYMHVYCILKPHNERNLSDYFSSSGIT